MPYSTLFTILLLLLAAGFYLGQRKALDFRAIARTSALPFYHGAWFAVYLLLPACLMLGLWSLVDGVVIKSMVLQDLPAVFDDQSEAQRALLFSEISRLAVSDYNSNNAAQLAPSVEQFNALNQTSVRIKYLLSVLLIAGCGLWSWSRLQPTFNARVRFERVVLALLLGSACVAIFTTAGIVFSVLFEALRFFDTVPLFDFIFGTHWSPQMSIREGQVGSSGAFGAVPLFVGTMLISAIAMTVAVPLGLMAAIYLSEYATHSFRTWAKPTLEILAGIPTVVYGFFAAITVAPLLRNFGESLGLGVASESALAAGLVMGVMIIPFVSSLSDDVINAVPQSLRDGAYALGATRAETIRQVIIPAALPGIVGGILLAVSRAIGETMIVVMAAGLSAKLTVNPLEAVTTVTVQIVTLLVGDQEFDSPKTLAAFALGLMLFVTTLCLNIIALKVVRRYREQYD
ncbi:MAG: phosphate ABC transporter permease subunit PstC [Pseudomonadales bacterium]